MKINTAESDSSDSSFHVIKNVPKNQAEPVHWQLTIHSRMWRPPTDVYETEHDIVIRIEIAGMAEKDFTIALDGSVLSIRGSRPDKPGRRGYHQMEIRFGEFGTDIELPLPVIKDEIEATYRDGFLMVVLPKARTRRIPVEGE